MSTSGQAESAPESSAPAIYENGAAPGIQHGGLWTDDYGVTRAQLSAFYRLKENPRLHVRWNHTGFYTSLTGFGSEDADQYDYQSRIPRSLDAIVERFREWYQDLTPDELLSFVGDLSRFGPEPRVWGWKIEMDYSGRTRIFPALLMVKQ